MGELLFEGFGGQDDDAGDLALREAEPFTDLGLGEILVEKQVYDPFCSSLKDSRPYSSRMRSSIGMENDSYSRFLTAAKFGPSSPSEPGPGASSDEPFVSRESFITSTTPSGVTFTSRAISSMSGGRPNSPLRRVVDSEILEQRLLA